MAAGLLWAVLPLAAGASGLSVMPAGVEFAAGQGVQGLWLSNTGTTPIDVQLRLFQWTQEAGDDRLTPSTRLVVSPPMTRIAPGQRQLVRIIRTRAGASPAPAGREQSFRLLVDELPPAVTEPAEPPAGLNFVLRFSVPVFVAPDIAPAPSAPARLSLERAPSGPVRLQARNPTPRRLQLADLRLLDGAGETVFARPGLLGYVLAGTERSWPLELEAGTWAAAKEIRIRINGETVRHALSALPLEWPAP
ncbi:MAG: molecular chaperone [Gammaproteobacteria bacterium]|nr:molecular chaperone [Gammaproteobacteria bacterium]